MSVQDAWVTKAPLFTAQNHLIECLPKNERHQLLRLCEPVDLVFAEILGKPGQRISHAYFPVDGYISLLQQTDGHQPVEVGLVGREGLLGAELALGGTTASLHAVVRGPGVALRVTQGVLRGLLSHDSALRLNLQRYVNVRMAQLASAVACQRFHLVGARLARRLLMSQDRACADILYVTHEDLAQMLGIRRVGVTIAAGELQRSGLIAYHRGELQILDRIGLQVRACSCYASDQRIYSAYMG